LYFTILQEKELSYEKQEKNQKMFALFALALLLIIIGFIIKCTDAFITDVFNTDKPEWISQTEAEMKAKNLKNKTYANLKEGQYLRFAFRLERFAEFELRTSRPVVFKMYIDGVCVYEGINNDGRSVTLENRYKYNENQRVYYDIECLEKTSIYLYSNPRGGLVCAVQDIVNRK
jgi:hypothetical protein